MKKLLIVAFVFMLTQVMAQTSKYYLLEPMRDGKKEQFVQIGENNGTKLFAMASCEKCMPAVYQHNKEASELLQKPVFGKSGIYVLPYDADSYVSVAPKSPLVALGKGVWETFYYVNFFSKDKAKTAAMTKDKTIAWAIELSKKLAKK